MILNNVCTIVGIVCLLALSTAIVCIAIRSVIESWKERGNKGRLEKYKYNLNQVNRFCSYEFPQIQLLIDRLLEAIEKDQIVDADQFREEARDKFIRCKR